MGARIGSRKTAREFQDIAYGFDNVVDNPDWQELGGGCRIVWLHHPSAVVYKADFEGGGYEGYDNPVELKNARALLRRTDARQMLNRHIGIPLTSGFTFGYNVIVAMQYVIGELGYNKKASPPAQKALFNLGFADMHGHNYIVDDKDVIWPIDLASARRSRDTYCMPDKRALNGAV
jgi:hypothetical protein